jgi:hypothetical protein
MGKRSANGYRTDTNFKNQRGLRNEKGLHFCKPLNYLARPAGFEPTTPWFVARYSIQLSYERVKRRGL